MLRKHLLAGLSSIDSIDHSIGYQQQNVVNLMQSVSLLIWYFGQFSFLCHSITLREVYSLFVLQLRRNLNRSVCDSEEEVHRLGLLQP